MREVMPCLDCGVNTGSEGIREYYHVHDELWAEAIGDDDPWLTGASEDPNNGTYLCIECLENRLGRGLVATDFSDAPINDHKFVLMFWKIEPSERMKQRVESTENSSEVVHGHAR